MMYTISWFDDKGVHFRVSFPDKKNAQSYFDNTNKIVESFKCSDLFKELKFYEEE